MWELLQKLEDLWWKPYWKSIAELTETEKNVRLLTSRSSWLWQFVCENGMVDDSNFYTREKVDEERDWIDVTYSTIVEGKKWGHYRYRLIESALKDESELEQFLLDNIKIDG